MHFQKLYSDIFNESVPDAGSISMLKKVADEYPYFSLSHFFLLKQAIDAGGDIDKIASKTAIHFNNPFLLNEQLHRTPPPTNGFDARVEVEKEEIKTESLIPPMVNEQLEIPEPAVDEIHKAEIKEEISANNQPLNEKDGEPAAPEKLIEEVPLFEPLFASDYFASQGIKLSEEQQPTDRMGKQLKSFTEWLKTMKKVHDPKLPHSDAPVDLTVQNLAEKSNKEEEVITEAMAEVFLQQGKTNKAKEIYEKLSLLNPSKSAYFAAKLEQIN